MARNRKNMSAAVRFGPAIKALLLCLFIGGAGVGYVWQKNQIYALGQQIKESEKRLNDLTRQNQTRITQLDMLRSPKMIDQMIRRLNLPLVQPGQSQIFRLVETPANGPGLGFDRQIAAGSAP